MLSRCLYTCMDGLMYVVCQSEFPLNFFSHGPLDLEMLNFVKSWRPSENDVIVKYLS